MLGPNGGALLGHRRFDHVEVAAHVHAIGHGLLVRVFAHHVLIEEGEGARIGRGGEAHEVGIEVVQHLLPQVVDAAVALVDDDEVEELRRDAGVVGHRCGRLLAQHALDVAACLLLGALVQRHPLQDAVHPLDGADAHLRTGVDEVARQALHRVELGELALVVVGRVALELLLGLLAQVLGVHQEEDALHAHGRLQQAVHTADGREGLAAARGHLHQGARLVLAQALLQVGDGVHLAGPQAGLIQRRELGEPRPQAVLLQPFLQGLRPVEAEHLPRPGLRVAQVPVAGDLAGAEVDEGQDALPDRPAQLGRGIPLGLPLVHGELLGLLGLLGLHHAHGHAVHEEDVVRRTHIGMVLPHRHAKRRADVDGLGILHHPAGRDEHGVDGLAGLLFGGEGHCGGKIVLDPDKLWRSAVLIELPP